ncbi:hypothetical protein [Mesorhizobium sp. M7A.F.Ce.TU.012.03.2.1]|uniref:hypothetical protein n=1 Tax=Mesorhizobium sp. M7A.F.Ce.TU.012.03.2.1 TaxID=2493681 RepID=UPI0013E395EF|nr:hypothetical protein [Mesorhizobium sp. M7A.F.Ce.TU.012.03.2.1]
MSLVIVALDSSSFCTPSGCVVYVPTNAIEFAGVAGLTGLQNAATLSIFVGHPNHAGLTRWTSGRRLMISTAQSENLHALNHDRPCTDQIRRNHPALTKSHH